MNNLNPRMYLYGWLVAAALAFIGAGIEYSKSGDIFTMPALLGLVAVAMAIISRGRHRRPPAA